MRRFRIHAASRNQSMTNLMEEAILLLMDREKRAATAKQRFMDRIRNAPARGTGGTVAWTRDELHER